jgi:hypothetical protein
VNSQTTLAQISTFVQLQDQLISLALSGQTVESAVFLRDFVPQSVQFNECEWRCLVHGVGVRFCNLRDGTVIDAHVGVLDHPMAFDAFRLSEYFESIGFHPSSFNEVRQVLLQLQSDRRIKKCDGLENHYFLTHSGDAFASPDPPPEIAR